MSTSTYRGVGTAASATSVSATLTDPSTPTAASLNNTFGAVAMLKRQGAGAIQPNTPAGWTLLNSVPSETSGTVGVWFFYRRCDGTFNNVTITSAVAANNTLVIACYSNIKEAVFVENFSLNNSASARTSCPLPTRTSTEDDSCVVGMVGHVGTAGGTGFTVPVTAIRRAGGSSSSGYTWFEDSLGDAGTSAGGAVSWTTSNVASGAVLVVKTEPVITDPPPVLNIEEDKYYSLDATSSTGEFSYGILHTSGPDNSAGILTVSPGVWEVPKDAAGTSVYTVSATGTGGTTTRQVTVPPRGVGTAGIRQRVWDGSDWV